MATREIPDGLVDDSTGAVARNPALPDAACLAGLQGALDACRGRMSHFQGTAPNAAAYNAWHMHARAIERAIGLLTDAS